MTIQKDHGYRRIARRPNSLSLSENNGSLFFEIGDPNGLMVDQKFNSQKKYLRPKTQRIWTPRDTAISVVFLDSHES